MNDLVAMIRAIVGDELARRSDPQLGVVTAIYARDADGSDNNHQVNVRVPALGVELQRVGVAVDRAGRSCLPRVDDTVLVVFVGGDLQHPVVVGTVYDAATRPPVGKSAEIVYETPDPEESGVRRLAAKLPSGVEVVFDDATLVVTMGGTIITVEADGDVTVKSAANVSIECDADIGLKASGNIDIEAQGNLTLKSRGSATLEAAAAATIKSAAIKIAGVTQFSAS